MSGSSSRRQDEIFLAVLGVKDPAGRRAFLQQACANEPELLAAVEELLAVQAEAEKFFEACNPALVLDSSTALPERLPTRLRQPKL